MGYTVYWRVKGSRSKTASFKKKTGKFGASDFEKHLKEVYGKSLVSLRIRKVKARGLM